MIHAYVGMKVGSVGMTFGVMPRCITLYCIVTDIDTRRAQLRQYKWRQAMLAGSLTLGLFRKIQNQFLNVLQGFLALYMQNYGGWALTEVRYLNSRLIGNDFKFALWYASKSFVFCTPFHFPPIRQFKWLTWEVIDTSPVVILCAEQLLFYDRPF